MMCRITLCYVLLAYLLTYSAAESPPSWIFRQLLNDIIYRILSLDVNIVSLLFSQQ